MRLDRTLNEVAEECDARRIPRREGHLGLEIAPDRPLARLVINALTLRTRVPRRLRWGSYVPPSRVRGPALDQRADGPPGASQSAAEEQCLRILRAALLGEGLDELGLVLHPDAVLWSPTMCAVSCAEAVVALRQVIEGDTLTDVSISVVKFDLAEPNAYLEWRLSGRFSNPCFVDSDLLLEPTGGLVETAGVMTVTRLGDLVVDAHCYYDDLALLEQLLTRI